MDEGALHLVDRKRSKYVISVMFNKVNRTSWITNQQVLLSGEAISDTDDR